MTTADDAFLSALLEDDPERLYDRAPCGYLTTGDDGTVHKVSQTFLAMTGYPSESVLGRRFPELLSVGGRLYFETHFAPMLHMGGTVREIAFDLVRSDGSRLPVLVNAVAEPGPSGRVEVVRVAVFDATRRRAYERELLRAKERAEESEARARALARTLQQTLIPPTPPTIPDLDVAAAYRPAGDGTEVGGDFYDVFEVANGDWVITLGDVCGKGSAAAVITALARYTLRAASMESASPARALARVNEVMLQSATDRFCTVVVIRLHRSGDDWEGVVGCAGHPLPLCRRRDGSVEPLGARGRLLGVMPEAQVTDASFRLGPGELLLLHTDGLPEARQDGEFFGDERLQELLAANPGPARRLVDRLLADVLTFQDGVARDDIAIVAVRNSRVGD